MSEKKYDIKELSELGEVSRRTVRFYVQKELLPKPTGTGRGKHYRQEHLDALLRIKTAQESGKPLDQIKEEMLVEKGVIPKLEKPEYDLSGWIRIKIGEGIELHLRRSRAPTSEVLGKLVEEIRLSVGTHLPPEGTKRGK